MNNRLNDVLAQRQDKVATVLAYLDKTQSIFEQHASQELQASKHDLENIRQGFESDKIRIVVIGEFSRGKSRLINALLGINLLPSAKEATTAINTFLQSPSKGREGQRYIKLNFIDQKRPSEELSWDDDGVLKRWGTELDKSNGDARRDLQKIEVFAPHDLLDKGLVIIDTPGLESVVAHHEEITRQAIASSHIAIWVQSVEQLGGNSREWQFLTDTIRHSFRKFVTVVNMWDQVLEPEDDHDREKSEQVRVEEKLTTVRDNFKHYLPDLSPTELQQITNEQHLMGVSAKWALSKDKAQQKRSGVDRLVHRIADLCDSGEASKEVFFTPLKKLDAVQKQILQGLDGQLVQLDSAKDLQEQQNELDLLESQIKNQDLELKQTSTEHREDHVRVAGLIIKEVNETLVEPLKSLRDDIDVVLTEQYVRREVEAGRKNIALPSAAKRRYEEVTRLVDQAWQAQKAKVEGHLNNLKSEYVAEMNKQNRQLEQQLDGIEMDLPEIKIEFKFDLSSVERFQKKKLDMERALEQREEEIDSYEQKHAEVSNNEAQVRAAQSAYERQSRQIEALGEQPNPHEYSETIEVKEAGTYSDAKYEERVRRDYSNVEAYKAEKSDLKSDLQSREAYLQKMLDEEGQNNRKKASLEAMKQKAEKQFKREEKKRQKLAEEANREKESVVAEILAQLRSSTMGELNQRITFLEKNMQQSVEKVFTDQLDALLLCVEEQFMQPLRAKRDDRKKMQSVLEQGTQEMEKCKNSLLQAKKELQEVMSLTQVALVEG